MEMERRVVDVSELEVRSEGDNPPKIVGYAALFNTMSKRMGRSPYAFREMIAPGAFTESLGGDVRALINHNPNFILGRTVSQTLRLWEDERGLGFEVDPPETQYAKDLLVSIRRGDINQMSFGFRTIKDAWEEREDEDMRTLMKVELFDVSPTTFTAYDETSVAMRSLEAWREDNARQRQRPGALRVFERRLALLGG